MVIVKAMGGLGNQPQQYALYRKLEQMGKDARLDTSWFFDEELQAGMAAGRELELSYFVSLPYRKASEADIRSVLGRLWEEPESLGEKFRRKIRPAAAPSFVESDMYHEEIFDMDHRYLAGYWACDRYYADIMDILRRDIVFPPADDAAVQERNEETARLMEETQSVSVHIRRGDYLDENNRALFGGICTEAYYNQALAYMKERLPQVRFFLFSDDIPYVRERYRGGISGH